MPGINVAMKLYFDTRKGKGPFNSLTHTFVKDFERLRFLCLLAFLDNTYPSYKPFYLPVGTRMFPIGLAVCVADHLTATAGISSAHGCFWIFSRKK